MKCHAHPEVDATGYCRNCGKAMCPECSREVRGALYCEECLGRLLGAPSALPGGTVRHAGKAGVAAVLGFIPGLGAVYNGEYIKALIHVLVFGGIIAALSSNLPGDAYYAFFGIALGCFYFYMPIDAYRVARARNEGEPEPGPLVEGDGSGRKPIGAFVLIALGILFLMANFGLLRTEWFAKAWPAGLVVLGIWLLIQQVRRSA